MTSTADLVQTYLRPGTLHLGPIVEPALVLLGTVAGCALLHAIIRRSNVLRPLFGMKWKRRQASAASMSLARDSGVSVGA
mgnify:CR=1 FL=1